MGNIRGTGRDDSRRANRSVGAAGNEGRVVGCCGGYDRQTRTTGREGLVTSALASRPALTAADRCDRCGAQAYIRVTLPSGGELLFCAHHGRAHEAKLREVAVGYQDQSELLSATPATATDDEH